MNLATKVLAYYNDVAVATLWNFARTTTNKLLWLLFHQHQLRRRDKKEVALFAPVELVSPCILAGEENVTTRYQLILSLQLHMNLATKVLACYYDVAVVAALWNSAQTTTNKLLWLLFHQRILRKRDKKEAALLVPVELVSPCILVGEENVTTILSLHREKKKERKWKMLWRFSSCCCSSHQQHNPIAKFVANWAKCMAEKQWPRMDT